MHYSWAKTDAIFDKMHFLQGSLASELAIGQWLLVQDPFFRVQAMV
jgi:hypothetical protein